MIFHITFLLLFLQMSSAFLGIFSSDSNPTYANFDAYPNPQSENFSRCKIPSRGFLCDPEAILGDEKREQLFKWVESFPNKTKNPYGKTECEREGVNIGIGMSRNFGNLNPGDEQEIADAFATRWFPPTKSNCSKHIMVMIVYVRDRDAPGFKFTRNLPISYQQLILIWANAHRNLALNYFSGLVGIIEEFQHIIQHDIHSQNLRLLLEEQSKPFAISAHEKGIVAASTQPSKSSTTQPGTSTTTAPVHSQNLRFLLEQPKPSVVYANTDAFPNPQSDDFSRCNIPRRGFFCDPKAMIDNKHRSVLFTMVENFPNKTRNPFGKSECERKGVTLGLGLSHDFWDVMPDASPNELAGAFARKWFKQIRTNCSKHIMVMVVYLGHDADGLKFAFGINHTKNLPISDHQITNLWANARLALHDNYFGAFAGIIERLQMIIQHDIYSSAILSLQNQPKPFVVPVWLCIFITVCCSLMVSTLMFTVYLVFIGKQKKTFNGPISVSQLSKMELEGQSYSHDAASLVVDAKPQKEVNL